MKSRQVVYHEASPQSLHRVSLFTLVAKDRFEDNFILHSVWFSGGREWIGQTDILWKAIPSSFTHGTEGQQMPQASVLTWNVSCLPSRTWARTTLTHFSIQYLKLEEQEGVVPSSCIDLSEHLATEARSSPCFQGHFNWESSLMTVLSRKPIPALLWTLLTVSWRLRPFSRFSCQCMSSNTLCRTAQFVFSPLEWVSKGSLLQ